MAQKSVQKTVEEDPISGIPPKDQFIYTPHFCEENIWMMVKKIQDTSPEKLQFCYPIVISNNSKHIPLWRQTASKQEDGLVVWDYHVIMVYSNEVSSWVFDFDTQLSFPTPFKQYCEETFKSDEFLNPLYHRLFRVTSAENYLKYFSSDRRHMIKEDGTWQMPPPKYPPITSFTDEVHNLPNYISMTEEHTLNDTFGKVFNLHSFVEKFSYKKHCQLDFDYTYPPESLQGSFLE